MSGSGERNLEFEKLRESILQKLRQQRTADVIIENGDLANAKDVEATAIIPSHLDDGLRKIEERGYTLGCVSDSLKGEITDELLRNLCLLTDREVFKNEEITDAFRRMFYTISIDNFDSVAGAKNLIAGILSEIKDRKIFKPSQSNARGPDRQYSELPDDNCKYSVMWSLPGGGPQINHSDYSAQRIADNCYTEKGKLRQDRSSPIPLVTLVAFQDYTYLYIVPKSHKVLLGSWNDAPEFAATKRIVLMKGEYITFHPLMVHSGSGYAIDNCRLHIYMDVTYVSRIQDTTYAINPTENGEVLCTYNNNSTIDELRRAFLERKKTNDQTSENNLKKKPRNL